MKYRIAIILLAHTVIFCACYYASYLIRFEFNIPAFHQSVFWKSLPLVVLLKCLVCALSGEWRRGFRYATLGDLVRLVAGITSTVPLLLIANYVFYSGAIIPRSVIVIDWTLTILATSFLRSFLRIYRENIKPIFLKQGKKRTIIYGADNAGVAILRTLRSTAVEYQVVAFIDDRPSRKGFVIDGLPVYSAKKSLQVIDKVHAEHILISSSIRGKRVRKIIEICSAAGISASVIPSVREIVDGRYEFKIRDVTVSDLLRREPAQLDMAAIKSYVTDRCVLITGAAGSIGSELCRQILQFHPHTLILLDRSENGMFAIERELSCFTGAVRFFFVVGDVTCENTMSAVLREHRPELVFHAAAYKHVPLMEENSRESIRNNVVGTKQVADLAHQYGVESFVQISTDKAVNPVSIMGCTKLVAEKYVHSLAAISKTRFITVRFGNVLDSQGSVVPTFRDQIEARGPVTVTHPEMERFFMLIPEATQLVLQAAAIGKSGDLLVLDMGDPVKIIDLAKDMIFLSGLKYPDDIDIVFTGIRPGEKLYEELFYPAETGATKIHDKIFCVARPPCLNATINADLAKLTAAAGESNYEARATLNEIATTYAAQGQQVFDTDKPLAREAA